MTVTFPAPGLFAVTVRVGAVEIVLLLAGETRLAVGAGIKMNEQMGSAGLFRPVPGRSRD